MTKGGSTAPIETTRTRSYTKNENSQKMVHVRFDGGTNNIRYFLQTEDELLLS